MARKHNEMTNIKISKSYVHLSRLYKYVNVNIYIYVEFCRVLFNNIYGRNDPQKRIVLSPCLVPSG